MIYLLMFLVVMSDVTIYVDDTTLFCSHSDLGQLHGLSEKALDESTEWFSANGLLLNVDKTDNLLVSTHDICDFSSVKLLGIYIDNRLSWQHHIDFLCTRLSRVKCLLSSLRNHVTNSYLKLAYFAFFESIIRFGIVIWGNGVGIGKVLVIQKKVIRIVTGAKRLDHCKSLFIESSILTVVNLYIYEVSIFVKKNSNKHVLRGNVHSHLTRNRNFIDVSRVRLSRSQNYHTHLGIKIFNMFPVDFRALPLKRIFKKLLSWCKANPMYKLSDFFNLQFVNKDLNFRVVYK